MTCFWIAIAVIPAIFTFRISFRTIWEDTYKPNHKDLVACGVLALLGALLWPVILPPWAAWAIVKNRDPARLARLIGGESRTAKAKRQQREREELQRTIHELERELLDREASGPTGSGTITWHDGISTNRYYERRDDR